MGYLGSRCSELLLFFYMCWFLLFGFGFVYQDEPSSLNLFFTLSRTSTDFKRDQAFSWQPIQTSHTCFVYF